MIKKEILDTSWESGPDTYIFALTTAYLNKLGGSLTNENMNLLNNNQHTLLAYRIMLDEVSTGGFIQLIQNGYGPYVIGGPFAMMVKKEWNLVEFGKFMYKVRKEYFNHKEELEREMSEEEFMASYEEFDTMNNYGDDFLDLEETMTPKIAEYVRQHESDFI